METIKFFTDTETSGLLKEADQIFSYSIVLEEKGGQTIEAYEKFIQMKENVMPNPRALLVNNINPFTAEWKKNAMTEFEACLYLVELAKKYKRENKKLLLIAYNAEFDVIMYSDMFRRCGFVFSEYFSMVWDPLPTVKKLIEKEIIVTPEIQTSYSKSYRTSKLEAVYKALGYDSSSFNAHTALDDTLMLQTLAHGVYFLATGKKLEDMNSHPENYIIGQTVHIITDETNNGLVKKHIKIIFNDINNQKLLVLDEELLKAQSPEGAIKFLNYNEILDEIDVDKNGLARIESYYNYNQQIITESANMLLNKKEKKIIPIKDFSMVINLAEKILNSSNKKTALANLSPEELVLLKDAEDFAYAKYNKGWRRELEGENFLSDKKLMEIQHLKLYMDPIGKYQLFDGEVEISNTEKKTEIQEKLLSLLGLERESVEYKTIVKSIPSTKDFKNSKYPALLKEEFENAKAEVFQATNKTQKEILTDLLVFYKKKSPEFFNDVNLPSFKLDLSSLMKKK